MLFRADTMKRWSGELLPVSVDTALVHYEDGRREEIKVAPYVVMRRHPFNVETLWTGEQLLAVGLLRVVPAAAPEGKEFVGDAKYERDGDVVREVRETRDLPPPSETVTITVDEHERLVADAEKWRLREVSPPANRGGETAATKE